MEGRNNEVRGRNSINWPSKRQNPRNSPSSFRFRILFPRLWKNRQARNMIHSRTRSPCLPVSFPNLLVCVGSPRGHRRVLRAAVADGGGTAGAEGAQRRRARGPGRAQGGEDVVRGGTLYPDVGWFHDPSPRFQGGSGGRGSNGNEVWARRGPRFRATTCGVVSRSCCAAAGRRPRIQGCYGTERRTPGRALDGAGTSQGRGSNYLGPGVPAAAGWPRTAHDSVWFAGLPGPGPCATGVGPLGRARDSSVKRGGTSDRGSGGPAPCRPDGSGRRGLCTGPERRVWKDLVRHGVRALEGSWC